MKRSAFLLLLAAVAIVANLPARSIGQQEAGTTPVANDLPGDEQESAAGEASDAAQIDGELESDSGVETQRLPPGYSEIITNSQRRKIYQIQQGYQSQIDVLQRQIAALVATRDAEIGAVLDPQQQQVLKFILEIRERNRTEMEQTISTQRGVEPPAANGPVPTEPSLEDTELTPIE
ncbi:hypothetical protein [Rosistilla oblonga]|uniref:hypothetical protein n=1 Tax=Rosistilla oblonga TaxID=2527990 RepID=UPI003A976AFA